VTPPPLPPVTRETHARCVARAGACSRAWTYSVLSCFLVCFPMYFVGGVLVWFRGRRLRVRDVVGRGALRGGACGSGGGWGGGVGLSGRVVGRPGG